MATCGRLVAVFFAFTWIACGPVDPEPTSASLALPILSTSPGWTSFETEDTGGVRWGDADGDGFLDLAVAGDSLTFPPSRLYLNDGGGLQTDASAWDSADSIETYNLAWGDWNGDGHLDLALANAYAPVVVWVNDGTGALSIGWTEPTAGASRAVAWADWDNDGDLDLAVANAGNTGMLRVYVNDGLCQWSPETCMSNDWTAPEFNSGIGLQWADFDQDGDVDLAVGNDGSGDPSLGRIYVNDGSCLAAPETCMAVGWVSDPGKTVKFGWADWDGDGDLDLARARHILSSDVLVNDGTCATTPASCLTSGWSGPITEQVHSIAWGDWDGDGDPDLVTGTADDFRVYANDGLCDSSPSDCLTTAAESATESAYFLGVEFGDWDNDGDLELASGRDDHVALGWPNHVYVNDGAPLGKEVVVAEGTYTQALAWGDWDGDGDLDLVLGNDATASEVYVNDDGVLSLAWTEPTANNASTATVAWGDWDGDGDLDLAVGNLGAPDRVYVNDGGCDSDPAGCLSSGWGSDAAEDTWAVAWVDWDGDSDLDLLCGRDGVDVIYENEGPTVGLGAAPSLAWTTVETDTTRSIDVGDIDDDGAPDLITGAESGLSRVYRNDAGALVLLESIYVPSADETRAVGLADFDADGDLDVVLGQEGGSVHLYANDGSGSFSLADSAAVRGEVRGFSWGDFDGDAALELVAADAVSVSLLEASTGSLAIRWQAGLGSGDTQALAWGDADGDGDLDLAAGADGPGTSRLYINSRLSPPAFPNNPTYPVVGSLGMSARVATGVASAEILNDEVLTIPFTLFDDESDQAPAVRLEYSLRGGLWSEATLAPSSGPTAFLDGSPTGEDHTLDWDVGVEQLTIGHDAVRVRVVVQWQNPTWITYPIHHGALASTSSPFRLAACDVDEDGSTCALDCDDGDPTVFPGAPETADDNVDQDCNGADQVTCFEDADGDGFAGPSTLLADDGDCGDPGEGATATDCDDADPAIHPGVLVEFCNGVDDDCDPATDLDGADADTDADGVRGCDEPADCDDSDPGSFPGNEEVCDAPNPEVDNDCDPATGATNDVDGDGWSICAGDCDDDDATAFPGNVEVCEAPGPGVDNDCDPATDEEADADGDGLSICGADCDDSDPANFPINAEVCDGQDNDCQGGPDFDPDGEADADADGVRTCDGDCDDADPANFPLNAEACDGQDNDCDSGPDFDDEGEADADEDGVRTCAGDCDDEDRTSLPGAQEYCDDVDQDCDGDIAEDWPDVDEDGRPECPSAVDWETPGPGCRLSCDTVGDGRSASGALLFVLFALGTRRRRRRGLYVLAPALLLASTAWAGPAEDAATRASEVREVHCAEMAADRTGSMTSALAAVAPVLDEVSRAYEEAKTPYLLYWRGVLLQCSGQLVRALEDLTAFADETDNQEILPDLVRDARRRARRLERTGVDPATAQRSFGPRATIAIGGAYVLVADPTSPFHYGAASLDGSIGIVGPLRVVAFGRLGWGPLRETADGPERSALVPFGAGLGIRLGDAVAFRAQVLLNVAPNDFAEHGGPALLGVSAALGGAFQLGASPLELRPELTVGVLGASLHLSAGASVGLRIGRVP